MNTLPVTVIMPVKNDARMLAMSISRLRRFQKIVVVDSGSEDETAEVAAAHGADLVVFDWNGKYPKKRNWYLDNHEIETDWVLFLDADEMVNDRFCDEVERSIRDHGHVGYWLTFENRFMGRFLRHGDPFSKLALFRHDAGRYERIADDQGSKMDMEVHEHPVLDGTIGRITAPIAHDEQRGMDSYLGKHNDYSTWEAHRFVVTQPHDRESWEAMTARQRFKYRHIEKWWFGWFYFFMAYVLKRGFLDGRPGFVLASLKRQYYGHIRLKIQELKNPPPGDV